MEQIKGTDFGFAIYEDTTYGTLSAGHGVLLPAISVDLGLDQKLAKSNVLTTSRQAAEPLLDEKSVGQGFKVQPCSRSFGWLMKHHLGVPTGKVNTVGVTAGGSAYTSATVG